MKTMVRLLAFCAGLLIAGSAGAQQVPPKPGPDMPRIERKLGHADRYAESHFDGPNLYQAEIDRNIGFLREAIDTASLDSLRRDCYSLSERLAARA